MLGRLIPLEGSREVPGATRSASKGVSVGSGRAITFVESGCGFEGEEEVVDAAAILRAVVRVGRWAPARCLTCW